MGFFSNKNNEAEETTEQKQENTNAIAQEQEQTFIKTPTNNISTLNSLLKIKADIEGGGSLIIGGSYEGNVVVEDTIFIEKGAQFSGKIKAKNVKISGEFKGEIEALLVEVSSSSKFIGVISANKCFLAGIINGAINSKDSIEILSTGDIETKELKSSNIKVSGRVKGNIIASSLLEVTKDGSVSGEIVTKGIKTEQGGTIIGNIQTYDESLHGIDINYALEDLQPVQEIKEEAPKKSVEQLNEEDIQKYSKKEKKTVKRL
jgi:cytoskeletal protein CcmA (bactofilin family)